MDKMETRSLGIKALKVAGVVVVIVAIFVAGATTGSRFGRGRGEFNNRGYGMMGNRGNNQLGSYGMMGSRYFSNTKFGKGVTDTTRVFGVITKIENGQITITDNAGKSQVVYSLPTTIIATSVAGAQTEVSITTLKTGQSITAIGTTNETSKQFEAQAIRVQ